MVISVGPAPAPTSGPDKRTLVMALEEGGQVEWKVMHRRGKVFWARKCGGEEKRKRRKSGEKGKM